MKNLRGIYTLLFGVAVLLFFGLAYPHHLHYQEQYQLFLFDSTYVWDIVRLPGGVADLLGRFCTQFFLYAWVGALIIALLLSAIQFLVLRLFSPLGGVWDGASFIPSFLLWLFLLDENALLGGVWAVLLTLIASCLFALVPERPDDQSPKHPTPWLRLILLFAAIPILYWIVGPVCVVFFLLQIPRHKYSIWYYGAIVLSSCIPPQSMDRHTLLSLPDGDSCPAMVGSPVCLHPRTYYLYLPQTNNLKVSKLKNLSALCPMFPLWSLCCMEIQQFQGRKGDAI